MTDTKVAKISLSGDVEGAIIQTCDTYGEDGYMLQGIVSATHINAALLVFQKYASQDPTTTSSGSPLPG